MKKKLNAPGADIQWLLSRIFSASMVLLLCLAAAIVTAVLIRRGIWKGQLFYYGFLALLVFPCSWMSLSLTVYCKTLIAWLAGKKQKQVSALLENYTEEILGSAYDLKN